MIPNRSRNAKYAVNVDHVTGMYFTDWSANH